MATALRRIVVGTVVLITALGGSACARSGSGEAAAVGTSGEGTAFMTVELSSIAMEIENRAAQPLLDIRLAIKPVGGATEFTLLVNRLEAGEKRILSLGDFRGRDGTPFSLRVVRPKQVDISAVSLTNQKFAMTLPWK
jgi:hypothetical protein